MIGTPGSYYGVSDFRSQVIGPAVLIKVSVTFPTTPCEICNGDLKEPTTTSFHPLSIYSARVILLFDAMQRRC
jgi:hypothetical protein